MVPRQPALPLLTPRPGVLRAPSSGASGTGQGFQTALARSSGVREECWPSRLLFPENVRPAPCSSLLPPSVLRSVFLSVPLFVSASRSADLSLPGFCGPGPRVACLRGSVSLPGSDPQPSFASTNPAGDAWSLPVWASAPIWVSVPICVGLRACLPLLFAWLSYFFQGTHRMPVPLP